MTFDDLGPLREALERHGLTARKSFGQHFLLDLNVTRKVARAAGDLEGRLVLEVGPGPGGLTRALLEAGAKVLAIEKDRRFVPLLEELAAQAGGGLIVLEADALDVDERSLAAEHGPGLPVKIVANLPYNVGTPLLVKWLTSSLRPESLTLMFQREVARRIVAGRGDSDYGRLAVLAQSVASARLAFDLPARAFTPPPKVESSVVVLTPLAERPSDESLRALEQVTRAAFGQRRKMLRSSLKALGGEALCLAADVDPSVRAEDLTVEAFARLAFQVTEGSSHQAG